MPCLKITTAKNCIIRSFESIYDYPQVKIQQKRNQWSLVYAKKSYPLSSLGQHVTIDGQEVIFSLYEKPKQWSLVKLEERVTIGRSKPCTICIPDSTLSKEHFIIEGSTMKDPGSRNGTFVNGERKEFYDLVQGDHIIFGQQEAYFIPGYLILSRCVKSDTPCLTDFLSPKYEVFQPKEKIIPVIETSEYFIESPQSPLPVKKAKWFQTIGSSILILGSGIVSSLVALLSSKGNTESLFTLLLSSCSMSVAFGIYGLLNRESMYREGLKEAQYLIRKYDRYCVRCYEEIDNLKREKESQVQEIRKAYLLKPENYQRQMGSDFDLWLGYQKEKWLQLHWKKPNYLQESEALFQKQKNMIRSMNPYMKMPAFLKKGETIYISKNDSLIKDSLFLQWALSIYQPSLKWVWIDSHMNEEDPYLYHPGCRIGHRLLWIRSQQEWQAFLETMDSNYEYIYFAKESWINGSNRPDGTWIIEGKTNPNIVWDAFFVPASFYRNLLYTTQRSMCHQINFLSVYKKKDPSFSLRSIRGKKVNLRVQIGISNNNEPVYLDLDEKHDGPHGFVAGMTGSGKSELLKNILMQLVLQNDPALFQYILIDFKGGAFGQAFYTFSHCQGILTNLDHLDMERFTILIYGFLEERQRRIREFIKAYPHKEAHIDTYNQYHPNEHMAHVCILVDELAQIKQKYPEFLVQLKEISRIGRSLGVHCILSTQKPLGIIDDQILANSRFKICLKVASAADSYEVLHHERAKDITQPGLFILQGDTEVEGRSWYLSDTVFLRRYGFTEVDEMGNEMYSYQQEKQSLFQILSKKIEKRKQEASWLVTPFDQNIFKKEEFALIDDPYHRSIYEWKFHLGEQIAVYCFQPSKQKEWIGLIRDWAKVPVYGMGFSVNYGFDRLFSEKEFARIHRFILPCIWIVSWNGLMNKNLQILKNSNVLLFVLFDRIPSQVKFGLYTKRLCYDFETIEDVRMFFDTFVKSNLTNRSFYGWTYIHDQIYSVLFRSSFPCQDQTSKSVAYECLEEDNFFYLGFDLSLQKEIYWTRKRPLLIVYAQRSVSVSIQKMLDQWRKHGPLQIQDHFEDDADVYVIDGIHQIHAFQSEEFLSKVYDMDILWMGKGVQDYVYLLKRSILEFTDCDAVAWINEKTYYLKEEKRG